MSQKYYTENQIYAATFFGGPIPPGILIFKNLKRINDDKRASLTLMLTFIFTILLFFFLFQISDTVIDKIPDIVFTSFYTLIVYILYNSLLKNRIQEKVSVKENKESNWNVAGWTLLGLIANLIIIFGIAIFEPAFPGDKLTFGNAEHEVFYDKNDFSEPQIQKLGKMLIDLEYFYGEEKQAVRIEMRGDIVYLMMPFQKEFWENQIIINELTIFNSRFQYEFKKQTTIELIHYEFNDDTKTKTIKSFANNGA